MGIAHLSSQSLVGGGREDSLIVYFLVQSGKTAMRIRDPVSDAIGLASHTTAGELDCEDLVIQRRGPF